MNPSRSASMDAGNKETTMTTLDITGLDTTGLDTTGLDTTGLDITGLEITEQAATGGTR
jgi:hypothetical protein